MAASANFKASGFTDAIMQMNFWISHQVGIFVFIFGEHKLYFYISTVMRLRKCISVQYDFYLIRRDLALETFRNKFSYLNHSIITSKYKFSYWWKELIIVITWYNLCLSIIINSTYLLEKSEKFFLKS